MMPAHPALPAFPADPSNLAGLPLGHDADCRIEEAVRAMLHDVSQAEYISVSAHAGIVTLDGTVSDGRWLARFKNQVTASMPNVTIEDRLDWILQDCSIGYA